MASCVRQILVIALSVVVLSPLTAAHPQDNPFKPMFDAPKKARAVADKESSRVYKGDEAGPSAGLAIFSPAWNKKLEGELKRLESQTGATLSTTRPFADPEMMRANMNKPAWNLDELVANVAPDPTGEGLKAGGRPVQVEGTVLAVKGGAANRLLMVGDPADEMPHIAIVLLPENDTRPFKVGDHFADVTVYLMHASKKGEKQDAYIFAGLPTAGQSQGARTAPVTNGTAASPAQQPDKGEFTDALNGWRLVGIVHDGQGGVGVFVNKDGRKLYARTGHEVDKGITLLGLENGQARLMVDKKEFDVWPW